MTPILPSRSNFYNPLGFSFSGTRKRASTNKPFPNSSSHPALFLVRRSPGFPFIGIFKLYNLLFTFAYIVFLIISDVFSGYDFGYLLRILRGHQLPSSDDEFFHFLSLYFPRIYDVKHLMRSCRNLRGGLEEVAKQLEVRYSELYCFLGVVFLA